MVNTQKEKDLERLRAFRLMDDDFMTAVFQNDNEVTQYVLRILLEDAELRVLSVNTQHMLKNMLGGRSIKMDVQAVDANQHLINIEIQRADRGAVEKRARYHSSMFDASALREKQEFSTLPETYVIFITENDVLGKGLPLYHIERTIQETGELFADGEHILYVNGSYEGKDPVGLLMHDFRSSDPGKMNESVLRNKVRYFKESKEGKQHMCRMMEEMRNEAVEKNSVENYYAMLAQDFPEHKVRIGLGITDEILAKYPELKPKQ